MEGFTKKSWTPNNCIGFENFYLECDVTMMQGEKQRFENSMQVCQFAVV